MRLCLCRAVEPRKRSPEKQAQSESPSMSRPCVVSKHIISKKPIICEPVWFTNHLSETYRLLSLQNDSLTEMWSQTSSNVVLVKNVWVVWSANDTSVSFLVQVDSSIQNTKGILTVVVYLLPICYKLIRKVGSNMKILE